MPGTGTLPVLDSSIRMEWHQGKTQTSYVVDTRLDHHSVTSHQSCHCKVSLSTQHSSLKHQISATY